MARPTKFTEEVIRKIEEVAALDGTVKEMAFYADVNPDSVYTWLKNNPEFSERIAALREKPVLKARQSVVKSLDDPDRAFRYLERKRKDEFSQRVEQTGKDGQALNPITPEAESRAKAFDEWYKTQLQD